MDGISVLQCCTQVLKKCHILNLWSAGRFKVCTRYISSSQHVFFCVRFRSLLCQIRKSRAIHVTLPMGQVSPIIHALAKLRIMFHKNGGWTKRNCFQCPKQGMQYASQAGTIPLSLNFWAFYCLFTFRPRIQTPISHIWYAHKQKMNWHKKLWECITSAFLIELNSTQSYSTGFEKYLLGIGDKRN